MATISGSNRKNVLRGNSENDRIFGLGGADQLFGRGGDDSLYGGSGNDKLYGGAGSDKLYGGAGRDLLDGGTGADTLRGGTGNDTYVVNNAADKVIEKAGQGRDTVQTTLAAYTLGANVEILTYTGKGNFIGTGNGLDNILRGGAGFNVLDGGEGNDTFISKAGVTTFIGGNGSDTVSYAGTAAGSFFFIGAEVGVFVDLEFGTGEANAQGDTYTSIENVIGTDFIDEIVLFNGGTAIGGKGLDFLEGEGVGTSILIGGEGADIYDGNTGQIDYFELQVGTGADQIDDFETGLDKLLISGAAFGIGATLDAAELTLGAYTGTAPQLRYDTVFGELYIDPDGTGAFGEVLVAGFFAPPAIVTIADFVVV